jgi:DNA ligase (NAD+)
MSEWGLDTPCCMVSSKLSLESLVDTFHLFKDEDRDMDGLVISCLKCKRENVMYPENKVAFKMNIGGVKATVKKVNWSVSRTGRVIPVVEIDPVNIGGVTVKNVTGHNAKFVYENKIGKDSVIKIVRSGDVIPYILNVEKESDNFEYIENCPMCGNMLIISGVDIICNSDDCPHQKYKKVAHFLRTNGAENITEVTLEKLEIDTIEKCFELDEYDISFEEGFGIRSAQIIVDEIEKCLYTTPERLIASFGIPNFGKRMSKLVIDSIKDKFDNNKEMIDYIFKMEPIELEKIHGIGDITAKHFSENIKKFRNTLNYLYDAGLSFESKSKKFDGVKFALTGKGNFNRGEIVKLIENAGGIVGSVTKTTKYLVTSNVDSKSGKMKKAHKYGINIIDYEELMIMLKGE